MQLAKKRVIPSQGTTYLQGFVVPLQLPTQTLEFAPSQDGSVVFTLQLVLLSLGLRLLLPQEL